MTSGARLIRAAGLTSLAVGWAVAGHLLGRSSAPAEVAGVPHVHGAPVWQTVWPALWSALAVGLLAWHLVPRSGHGRWATCWRVVLVLAVGQLLTHTALSVAPLLGGQVRVPGIDLDPAGAGPDAAGHAGHLGHAAPLVGTPEPAALLAAVSHGGLAMALGHLGATLAAATGWVLLAALWQRMLLWWQRVTPTPARPALAHRAIPTWPPRSPLGLSAARAWDGRAPPRCAAATSSP